MTLLDILRQPAAQRLAAALLHFLWQGLAVALLAVAVMLLFRVRRPQGRYAVLLVALGLMAACPGATFLLVDAPAADVAPARSASVPPSAADAVTQPEITPATPAPVSVAPDHPATPTWAERFDRWTAAAGPWLVMGWLAGVAVLGGRLLLGLFAVQWIAYRRESVPDGLLAAAGLLASRLRLRRVPRVVACRRAREAMAVGLLRPMVLFPAAWLAGLPPHVLEAVLAHELAHIRRWDLWINLLQRVVETLLFYHPAVWWVSRRLRAERELCCDELAVTATGRPLEYAQALECVASRRLAESGEGNDLLLATGIGGRQMALLKRVRHVLQPEPRDSGSPTSRWSAGLIALALPPALWLAASTLAPPAVGDEASVALLDGRDRERERDGDRPARRDGDRERNRDAERRDVPVRYRDREDGDRPRFQDDDRRERGEREDRGREGERREADRDRGEPSKPTLGRLLEEYSELFKQRRFAEAEVVARQAVELYPQDPTAGLMNWQVRNARRIARDAGGDHLPHPPERPDPERLSDEQRELIERFGVRDGERPRAFVPPGGKPQPLLDELRRLREEVESLRREVNEMRQPRGPREGDPFGRPRPEGERRDGDRPRPEGAHRDVPTLRGVEVEPDPNAPPLRRYLEGDPPVVELEFVPLEVDPDVPMARRHREGDPIPHMDIELKTYRDPDVPMARKEPAESRDEKRIDETRRRVEDELHITREKLEVALKEAERQRAMAEKAMQVAEEQRAYAEAARKKAETQRRLAEERAAKAEAVAREALQRAEKAKRQTEQDRHEGGVEAPEAAERERDDRPADEAGREREDGDDAQAANGKAPSKADHELVLNVGFTRDEQGKRLSDVQVFHASEKTPVADFAERLRGIAAGFMASGTDVANVTLILRCDPQVSADVVQQLIRDAKKAGFQRFALKAAE